LLLQDDEEIDCKDGATGGGEGLYKLMGAVESTVDISRTTSLHPPFFSRSEPNVCC